ncbi:MAG: hypothetical protein AAF721_23565 [Myxococcota bacterium]
MHETTLPLCAATLIASLPITATSAPPLEPLPPAPAAGVDADVREALDEANAAVADGRPERATDIIIGMYASSDPFNTAQRGRVVDEARAVLVAAGQAELSRGRMSFAARSLDAAWEIAGRPHDPEYASLLVRWAEAQDRKDKATALYLARRAVLADASNADAQRLDRRLSTNRLRIPGWITLGLALGSVATGISMAAMASSSSGDRKGRFRTYAAASFGASAGLYVTGLGLLWGGKRNYRPHSPAAVPALEPRK